MANSVTFPDRKKGEPHRTGCPSEASAHLRATIMQMRQDGKSLQVIADELGYSFSYIQKQHAKALKVIYYEPVNQLRKIELARLDEMEAKLADIMNSFHPMISAGQVVKDEMMDPNGRPVIDQEGNPVMVRLRDVSPILSAIDKRLKVMERRARLCGLDAPTKVAATDPTGEKEAKNVVQFYLPSNGRDQEPEATE